MKNETWGWKKKRANFSYVSYIWKFYEHSVISFVDWWWCLFLQNLITHIEIQNN